METTLISTNPPIIHHCISSFSDDASVLSGVAEAVATVEKAAAKYGTLSLLLDFSQLSAASASTLSAHRIWATGFKDNRIVRRTIGRVAVVAVDSPKFRTEKAAMETETQHFFTDTEEAVAWLKRVPA